MKAKMFIVNNDQIKDYSDTNHTLSTEFTEYGTDHIKRVEANFSDHLQYPFLKYTYALSFFDINSENTSEMILDAFKQIKNKYLIMIGDWNKTKTSQLFKNKYAGYANIFMLYTISDIRQLNLIRSNAVLFIHTSWSGKHGISMLEAMSLGLPILAFESIDNKFLTDAKAAYFRNTVDISQYLDKLSIERLRRNAFDMYEISERIYKWDYITRKYDTVLEMFK
jgi:glycosyltransferase involved in cell wall biosynthesis